MQEESEQDRTEKEEAAFDDIKGDSSCHVRVTKLIADLKRYIVDKFHSPTARAKQVPFESIDLSTDV